MCFKLFEDISWYAEFLGAWSWLMIVYICIIYLSPFDCLLSTFYLFVGPPSRLILSWKLSFHSKIRTCFVGCIGLFIFSHLAGGCPVAECGLPIGPVLAKARLTFSLDQGRLAASPTLLVFHLFFAFLTFLSSRLLLIFPSVRSYSVSLKTSQPRNSKSILAREDSRFYWRLNVFEDQFDRDAIDFSDTCVAYTSCQQF